MLWFRVVIQLSTFIVIANPCIFLIMLLLLKLKARFWGHISDIRRLLYAMIRLPRCITQYKHSLSVMVLYPIPVSFAHGGPIFLPKKVYQNIHNKQILYGSREKTQISLSVWILSNPSLLFCDDGLLLTNYHTIRAYSIDSILQKLDDIQPAEWNDGVAEWNDGVEQDLPIPCGWIPPNLIQLQHYFALTWLTSNISTVQYQSQYTKLRNT